MLINIPVSVGELADKITILEIKITKIKNSVMMINLKKEHKFLIDILNKKIKLDKTIKSEILKLKKINLKLWDIEDGKRNAESNKKFDKKFITLARNVYIYNDKRAKIKLKINKLSGSEIVEVKFYKKY